MDEQDGNSFPTPGLKWRTRKSGKRVPMWFPDEGLVKAGFPVKSANLSIFANDSRALSARCQRLQAEANAWKSNRTLTSAVPEFDGTFGSLIEIYQTDPDSPFNSELKARSRVLYGKFCRKLKAHIGDVQIDRSDGRDVKRWFAVWAEREDASNPHSAYRKLATGRMALAVLKAVVSFGIICRHPNCAAFKVILSEMEFPALKSRQHAPTAAQIEAAMTAAIKAGAPSRALAYALQFDTTLRQTDVIGEWVALSDPRPSTTISRGEKWIGPSWSSIDQTMLLSITHGKTRDTSGARSVFDLTECPLVMSLVVLLPASERVGPLIVNEATGLPYRYDEFRRGWKSDYRAAGIPGGVWNRDTRAGGNTEAQQAGALLEDRKRVIGHTAGSRTTAQVYDRDTVESHRRVMRARKSYRKPDAAG